MPSIFLTTNSSYPLSSAFLVPASFLPSVLTYLYTPVLPFVCILSFLRFLSLFLSQLPISTLLLYVFVYLHIAFLSIQLLFLALHYSFVFHSFLSVFFSHFPSTLNSSVFMSVSIFLLPVSLTSTLYSYDAR